MNRHAYLAIVLLGLACTAAQAAFKPEPIPKDVSVQEMCHAVVGTISQKNPGIKKEPAYKGPATYGLFYLRGTQIPFAAYASSGDGKPDTVIADWNENGDLTDDIVTVIAKPATVTLPNGHTTRVILEETKSPRKGFTFQPAEWHRGEIEFNGKKHAAALLDTDMNGLKPGSNDILLVDMNGDDKFEIDVYAYRVEGYCPLSETATLGGRVWSMDFDAKTPDITFTAYTNATGTVSISIEAGPAFKQSQVMAYVLAGSTMHSLGFAEGQTSTEVPVGMYRRAFFMISVGAEGEATGVLQYRVPGALAIEKDKTKNLVLGKPSGLSVSVRQTGRKIEVEQKVAAGKDVELSSIMTRGKDGEMTRPPPPEVEVIDPVTQDVVQSGKMEYG